MEGWRRHHQDQEGGNAPEGADRKVRVRDPVILSDPGMRLQAAWRRLQETPAPNPCALSVLLPSYSHQLSRRGLTVTEFRERAIEENGLFALTDSGVDENGVEWEETRYFQDSKGLLPRRVL